MSPELRESLAVEQGMLRRLLEETAPLIDRCRREPPGSTERWALAGMLHSFYNGIENLFKRIAVECDGGTPGGPSAHRDLLDSMTRPGVSRPRVITEATRDVLERYLDFRHMFRHAYTFDLRWDKMADAVFTCEDALQTLESELAGFCDALEARPE